MAKLAFAADQADLRDLARARIEAAQTGLLVRYQRYLRGDQGVTLDVVLESAARLAEAELDRTAEPTPAERRAVLATRAG